MTLRDELDVQKSPVKGEVIRQLRETFDNGPGAKAGLSRQVFATRAGISSSTLQRAEDSEPGTSLSTLRGIAEALGVPMSAIYENDALSGMDITPAGTPPAWAAQMLEQITAQLSDLQAQQREVLRELRRRR